MSSFEFATATRILFGLGVFRQAGALAVAYGKKVMLVTGLSTELTAPLLDLLQKEGIDCQTYPALEEPTVDLVIHGAELAHKTNREMVIGFGGGSAIDTGKAIAALMTNPGDPMDYLEVIGKGRLLSQVPAPFLAIPTSAGTGAEVTRNAVLVSPKHKIKVSLRSPLMLPCLALVDPELTVSLPPSITASTGLDALTQLIEPYVSIKANAITDGLCLEGMKRAARSLQKAFVNGSDLTAREDMSTASLMGGLALANAGLGAVHGFAGPLGGQLNAPHGAICARLLPAVMEINLAALRQRQPESPVISRYDQIAQIITGDPGASAQQGIEWVRSLVQSLKIPSLSSYGMQSGDISGLVEKAAEASSMKSNPIMLSGEELRQILEEVQF